MDKKKDSQETQLLVWALSWAVVWPWSTLNSFNLPSTNLFHLEKKEEIRLEDLKDCTKFKKTATIILYYY